MFCSRAAREEYLASLWFFVLGVIEKLFPLSLLSVN